MDWIWGLRGGSNQGRLPCVWLEQDGWQYHGRTWYLYPEADSEFSSPVPHLVCNAPLDISYITLL